MASYTRHTPSNICIHIVQARDGSLVSWSDDVQTPGVWRYANGIQLPKETFEQYGAPASNTLPSPDVVEMEFKPLSAMCCSVEFLGRLSANGKAIDSAATATEPSSHWVKMKSDSWVPR